jgi:hypothetical protein
MATGADIAELKSQWRRDPCWDIEETAGFEAHRDELTAYREKCEREWAEMRERDLLGKAEFLGVPGNIALAQRFESLQDEVYRLSGKLIELEERINGLS